MRTRLKRQEPVRHQFSHDTSRWRQEREQARVRFLFNHQRALSKFSYLAAILVPNSHFGLIKPDPYRNGLGDSHTDCDGQLCISHLPLQPFPSWLPDNFQSVPLYLKEIPQFTSVHISGKHKLARVRSNLKSIAVLVFFKCAKGASNWGSALISADLNCSKILVRLSSWPFNTIIMVKWLWYWWSRQKIKRIWKGHDQSSWYTAANPYIWHCAPL